MLAQEGERTAWGGVAKAEWGRARCCASAQPVRVSKSEKEESGQSEERVRRVVGKQEKKKKREREGRRVSEGEKWTADEEKS